MEPIRRILVVEDDQSLQEVLEYNLRQAGHEPVLVSSGREALKHLDAAPFDLILLDQMLPEPHLQGSDLCKRTRGNPRTAHIPIIFLTSKGEEIDRVLGFELGADDYVSKPFSVRELMLRIRALLQRTQRRTEAPSEEALRFGLLRLDRAAHRVFVDEAEVELTALEQRLLNTLFDRKNRVQSRTTLLDVVWGISSEVETRTVDTHVKRLREKLGAAGVYIKTVRGVGYRFAENPGETTASEDG